MNATSLNMRLSPNAEDKSNIVTSIKRAEKVNCYGYYTHADGANWFLVEYKGNVGYCSAKYLTKK